MTLENKASVFKPEIEKLRAGELVYVGAKDLHCAIYRLKDASDDGDEFGFAGTAISYHESYFAVADIVVDAMKHSDR